MELVAVSHRPTAQALAPDRVPPVLLVLAGTTSVQFGAAIARTLFDDLGAAGTCLLRIGFAAIMLMALSRPHPRRYSRADLRLVAFYGLVLGGMNLTFYEALAHVPLGVAVTVEFVGPLGLAVVLSRRPLDLVWVALAAAGIVLLADPGGGSVEALGVVLALCAGGFWAAYIVLAERTGRRIAGGAGIAMAMVVATAVPLGPGIASGGSALLHPGLLAAGAAVALLSSAIPYSVELIALRRLPRDVFSVLMSLEPAMAATAGFLVLGQSLGARQLVAIGLVVAASAGATRRAPPRVDA
jgi:inner membrane transporter RhtA